MKFNYNYLTYHLSTPSVSIGILVVNHSDGDGFREANLEIAKPYESKKEMLFQPCLMAAPPRENTDSAGKMIERTARAPELWQ
jgi:hypothetical protein